MAEAARPRAVEYYNPRPLLLGLCFIWGIVVGFSLFYFAPPKQMIQEPPKPPPPVAAPTRLPDRTEGAPQIADVAPAPDVGVSHQPRMETLVIEPPVPALSTDGGLTGRTAQPLTDPTRRQTAPTPAPGSGLRPAPPRVPAPPPIPELMP